MRSAEEWVKGFWTDQHGDPWPMLCKLVRDAQRDAYAAALEAAAKVCEPMGADAMRLLAGEMTAQEVRSVRAFMAAAQRAIRALTPASDSRAADSRQGVAPCQE